MFDCLKLELISQSDILIFFECPRIFGLQSYKIDSELVVFFYKKYTKFLLLYSIFLIHTVVLQSLP